MLDKVRIKLKLEILLTRMTPKTMYSATWKNVPIKIYMGSVRGWIVKLDSKEIGPSYWVFVMKVANQVWEQVNIGQHI